MNSFYLQGGVDVSLERDWSAGMQAIYNHSAPKPGNALSWTEVYDASTAVLDSLLYSNSDKDTGSDRLNLNFHTDKVWDDKGKKMTWDVDYLRDNRDENMGFLSKTLLLDGTEIPGTNFDYNYLQHRKVDVVSSALDFILPFEKYKITAGAKVSFTNTRNGINYDTSDPTLVQDDYFRYKEQIYALYADYSREYSERFSMQLGLRMEHTRTTGISEAKDTEDKHDYTRLFPTVYLLYSPTDGHALNFSFSNRISRPSQNMVNPFPFYQNKYTYACGREDLKPSYTYNAELGYTLKNNFNVSAYYSYSDDVFFQVVDLDAETNVTSFLWENFMKTHAFGLNNSYTFRTKWLQAYAQHGVSYRRTTSSAVTTSSEEKGWAYDASLRNTFFFNEKKTLLATLSGSYSSRQYQGIYLMSPTYSVSAGMLYRLLDNKLNLSLNVNNLFVSHSKLETMSNGLKIIADNQFSFTSFRIGVSYTFGGAILQAWYPGQAGGTAVAEVLFGDYNPAGRLPVTFYRNVSQLPDFEDYNMTGRTYRYMTQEPLFPFGHGLSYTSFSYGAVVLGSDNIKSGEKLRLSVPVTNTGKCDGEEVVQVYLKKNDDFEGPITAIVRPPRFNGKELSLFISSVIDLRAMSSARESCPAEATTEKGMPVQDTFSGSSISPKAKRAVKRRLTATSTAFSSIFPCFTASTRTS
jgi:opacity protein-like surface antigen